MIGRWLCKMGFHKAMLRSFDGREHRNDLCARDGCNAIRGSRGWETLEEIEARDEKEFRAWFGPPPAPTPCPTGCGGELKSGYGFAGGGLGGYTYCTNDNCGYFDKVMDPTDE